jgi:hypothetical protein
MTKETKSAEQLIIPFPEQPGAPSPETKVPEASELVQGMNEFYAAYQYAVKSAFSVAAPYKDVSPVFQQALSEAVRYLELASMYMERLSMYASNPHLLQPAEGAPDAPTPEA